MRKRSDFIALIVVTILFNYAMTIGTTFNGILSAELHGTTLTLIGLVIISWLFVHWRYGWVWHKTSLDGVFVLWAIAFGVSLLGNLDVWRRIAIGLWYVGAYIGVWYVFWDVVANNGIKRDILIDGLLICGVVVLIFGYLQCRQWLLTTFPLITAGLLPFTLPRPVSTFGNPNFLSSFLIVIIPFILSRIVDARFIISRIALGIYGFLAVLLLFLTYSRGAWLGLAVGFIVWILLIGLQHRLHSVAILRSRWSALDTQVKSLFVGLIGLILIGVFITGLLFVRSFGQSGRTAGFRFNIFNGAVALFSEKPLTGHGLFTFGRGLARMQSMPPQTPHSHAHNAVLHIAAELGIPGLIALFVTLGVIVWITWRNWNEMNSVSRSILAAAAGAVAAFAVHHLTDMPAHAPAIALVGLLALLLILMPARPDPMMMWRSRGHPFAMIALWLILLGTGFWSSRVYADYTSALNYGAQTNDFIEAASRLQPVIDSEPALPLYRMQQAFLLGLAAHDGDLDAAREAVAIYENLVIDEPSYAILWSNLAALYWQLDEQPRAVDTMRQACILAPDSWQLAVNLGNYEQAVGNTEAAQIAYDNAVRIYPDASLMPGLEQLKVRRLVSAVIIEPSIPAQVVISLESDQLEQAMTIWSQNPRPNSSPKYVIDELLALAENDREMAEAALLKAQGVAASEIDQTWVDVGRARLASFDGDEQAVAVHLQTARDYLSHELLDVDFPDGISIAYAQFLRVGLRRQFLPHLYYPVDDPVLLYLLETT